MKENEKIGLLSLISVMLFMFALALGIKHGKETVCREAIDKGHAEYIVIDNRGNTEFRWIEIKKD